MLFNSLHFLIYLPIVVLVYYLIPYEFKTYWLLIMSYYFYMCWNAKYAILILASTIITYISGILLQKYKENTYLSINKKILLMRIIVASSLVLNLSILFYFKYTNFFIHALTRVSALAHIQLNIPTIDVLLPVGISFYTFQALGYTLDVYRDEIYAEKSFVKYALFVSFFPQLVAGPIERSKNLLSQLAKNNKFDFCNARNGFVLMLWGYFLKIVLADRIALFVDTVYGDFNTYKGIYLIVATVLFAVQIYCDFAGYSIIAMGAAKILGIKLMENFNAPYFSLSVAEFWRNWHISLTSWLKDYIYIPLGGSRKGKIRKYINILIVFLVSGLWHGANFSFVVWGGLNGLFQICEDIIHPISNRIIKLLKIQRESISYRIWSMLYTFVFVDFAWIFFRANSFSDAIRIIKNMFVYNPWVLFDGSLYKCGLNQKNFALMLECIVVLGIADYWKRKGVVVREWILKQDLIFRCLVVAGSIWFILLFGIWGAGYNETSFIYFQF